MIYVSGSTNALSCRRPRSYRADREIEDERRRVSNLPRVAGTLFQWYSKLEEHFGYHYRVVEDDEFRRTYDVRETLESRSSLQVLADQSDARDITIAASRG